jgi:TonB-dependent starch-binding outer membrane protein SusC
MKNNLLKRYFAHVKTFLLGYALQLILVSVAVANVNQGVSVSGKITSADDGETLPGVNVVEKGTSNGVVTDLDGSYTINVSSGATLVFSSVGYVSEEVVVGNRSIINMNMVPDITQLEELVVIGYGTAKKSDITGSISSVTGDDLKQVPVATVNESLTGRMAGVQVTTTEGSPDAEVRIRVRGGGSLTQDATPLFIVDGFPVNTISDISPSDIKSIDVLKDASSTAIYGSRGANGVIIVTTKGGTSDKLTVTLNSFYGAKRLAKTLDVLDSEDYVKWQYEYAMLRNRVDSYERYFGSWQDQDLYINQPGNNWQEQVYGRTGEVFSNDLSLRGGAGKLNYSFNYARFDEKAIMIGSDYVRNNVTLKVNNKQNDKIDIGFTIRYSETQINGSGTNEQNEASSADPRLKHSVTYAPIPIDGITSDDTDEDIASYFINPITATYDNDRVQLRRNLNMVGGFSWNILEELQYRFEIGLDGYNNWDDRFYGLSTYYVSNAPAVQNQDHPAVIMRNRNQYRFRNANTLTYDFKKLLSSNHSLRLLVGHEMIDSESQELTSVVHGFPKGFSAAEAFKLTSQGSPQSVNNFYSPDDKLLSFFGRLNYDLKNRYLISATYRADGSSKFLGSNQWGYFPSIAGAWKISEESFMDGASGWINSLKIRASYGEAGNNNIPVGQTVQNFESSITSWMNGFESFWAASKTMANPDLKWETTKTRNIGIDFGLFKGRLSGTVEAYQNTTSDLLIRFPVPGTGYDTQFRNMGETENKGIETTLNYIAIDKAKYGLNFSFNISFNRNNINSLGVMENFGEATGWASTEIGVDYLVQVGSPIGIMYGYRNDGRYEVSDFEGFDGTNWILKEGVANGSQIVGAVRPGVMKLMDLNGDGIVNIDDQTIIGDANPSHNGGFIINGYAGGFDLTTVFNWSYGNDIYNANKIEYTSASPRFQYRNMIDMMADGNRWTNIDQSTGELVNDPSMLASMNANTTMWSPYMARMVFSDWAVEKGSFLRLNTVSLGYTLPKDVLSKMKIQNLRFYATGYNLWMWTNYSGFDPEVSTRRKTPLTPGVDYSAYPRSRQLVLGLNFSF